MENTVLIQELSGQHNETSLKVKMSGDIEVCLPPSIQLMTPYVLLEQEDWFEAEIEFVRCMLKPGMQVVDIGANYGVYALTMANVVGPDGKVWAFEPAMTTSSYLQRSILHNKMANIQLVRVGLSDHKGTGALSLNTNSELNKLVHMPETPGICETIQLLRIDDCLEKYGWKEIDFVKLDAEGEESNIIKGGSKFLSSQSPLIMFEVKHGQAFNHELIDQFAGFGYGAYRLIPGLNILAPIDHKETLDPFQLNLFCCKKDRAQFLEEQGLLAISTTGARMGSHGDEEYWWRYLRSLPYTKKLAKPWRSSRPERSTLDQEHYQKALNCYARAHSKTASPAGRYACLKQSYAELSETVKIFANASRLQTLSRVLSELGFRYMALQILNLLIETFKSEQRPNLSEPFLPVSPMFDCQDPGDDIERWCLTSVLEQREVTQAFSSYFTGRSSLDNLEMLNTFGSQAPQMSRRLQLIKMRYGLQKGPVPNWILAHRTENNLNPELWRGDCYGLQRSKETV